MMGIVHQSCGCGILVTGRNIAWYRPCQMKKHKAESCRSFVGSTRVPSRGTCELAAMAMDLVMAARDHDRPVATVSAPPVLFTCDC